MEASTPHWSADSQQSLLSVLEPSRLTNPTPEPASSDTVPAPLARRMLSKGWQGPDRELPLQAARLGL